MSSEHRNQGSGISDELLGKTWTELRWLWEAERQARRAAEAWVAELQAELEAARNARLQIGTNAVRKVRLLGAEKLDLARKLAEAEYGKEQAEAKLAERENELDLYKTPQLMPVLKVDYDEMQRKIRAFARIKTLAEGGLIKAATVLSIIRAENE